jgi:hypothetical protein
MVPALATRVDDGRQDQRTAGQQVEGQLHGPVFLARTAPDGNQQIHGEQGDIEPDEDEKQVQAHEQAEDTGHQQEYQGKELLDPQFQLPHGQNRREKDDAGQKQHGQGITIHGVEIGDAQRGNPVHPFDELVSSGLLVIGDVQIDGDGQGQAAEHGTDDLDGPCVTAGDDQNRQQSQSAAEQQRR